MNFSEWRDNVCIVIADSLRNVLFDAVCWRAVAGRFVKASEAGNCFTTTHTISWRLDNKTLFKIALRTSLDVESNYTNSFTFPFILFH